LIALSWSAPSFTGGLPITGYRIYRGSSPNEEGAVPVAALGPVTSWTDGGLAAGSTCYYRISALNSVGEGVLSAEVYATTSDLPLAPLNLSAAPSDGEVVLTWLPPLSDGGASVTGYSLYRSTVQGQEALLATVNGTNYTDAGLANGQAYYYTVSATNAAGSGAMSNEVTAMPLTVPTQPLALAAVCGDGYVRLAWNQPSSNGGSQITGYNVYQGLVQGAETLVASVPDTTYDATGLTNGLTYYYKVTAVNQMGEGDASSVNCVPATVPAVPVNVAAWAGNGEILVSWSAPVSNGGAAVTAYKVYGAPEGGQMQLLATVMATDIGAVRLPVGLGPGEHSHNMTGLIAGHAYTFRLSAVNAIGEGPQSPGVTMTLPDTSAPGENATGVQTGSAQTVGLTLGGAAVALIATMGCFMVWYRKKD
jgi:LPXTG-motif cell wall-anchored protein